MNEDEEKREEETGQLIRDYKFTFGSPDSKRVLNDLKRLANYDLVLVPLDNNGRIDSHQVMRNEGNREVIVHILRKIKVDLGKPKQTEAIKE